MINTLYISLLFVFTLSTLRQADLQVHTRRSTRLATANHKSARARRLIQITPPPQLSHAASTHLLISSDNSFISELATGHSRVQRHPLHFSSRWSPPSTRVLVRSRATPRGWPPNLSPVNSSSSGTARAGRRPCLPSSPKAISPRHTSPQCLRTMWALAATGRSALIKGRVDAGGRPDG